ncbi:MAG: bifunctional oligoribonuclease/PAP phosphatase NrnA [Hydrogenimonas sp.]|nr:bifunctional oligoribonuclease/PAP phosphatase NrnA [Hydrogenimonas sp.]
MRKNDPYSEAKKLIESSRHITVTGHLNPDADALGTALGLWHIFKRLSKRTDLFFASHPLPQHLGFLPGFKNIRQSINPQSDLIVTVDSGSLDRIGIEIEDGVKIINIDHHRSNTRFADVNIVEPEFASASEAAFKLVESAGWDVSKEAAVNFYAALLSDTGFFGYEGVNERVFDFAKRLLKLGADAEWTARMLRENQPLSKLRLLPKVLQTLRLYLDGRVAGLDITLRMLEESGASVSETDDIVNYARSLATVEVGFLIREEADGGLKVSLRSKNRVDVCKIALSFGGGGHIRAAGFTVNGLERELLKEKLLKRIEEELQ